MGMRLGQYADNFAEAGFDDFDKVQQMFAEELGQLLQFFFDCAKRYEGSLDHRIDENYIRVTVIYT